MSVRSSPRKRTSSSGAALPPSLPPSTAASPPPTSPAKHRRAPKEEIDESLLDCPACPPAGSAPPPAGPGAAADRETWVNCSHCRRWFHCICVRLPNPDEYSKWYCQPCIVASSHTPAADDDDIEGPAQTRIPAATTTPPAKRPLQNVPRPPPRKSKRARLEVDYAAIQEGMPADPIGRWNRLLEHADVLPDTFRRMQGSEWTLDWLLRDPAALSEPVLVPNPTPAAGGSSATAAGIRMHAVKPDGGEDGAASASKRFEPQRTSIPGMVVPPAHMTISDIAELIGPDTPVEVIDVASQSSSKAWTLSSWAEYCELPRSQRKKVLNVISLEVTGTPMERLVEAPQLVRDVDWVSRDWPANKRGHEAREHSWPKVQRYVLMGVAGGYSDWHVDFAGSSVYYHVIYGQKTFLFAPPTPHNLAAYRAWCSSTRQDFDWLGDHVQGLRRIEVRPGDTMLIPSGWLHSVYTPTDTLVVGGNFLTDWNVDTQWKLVEIEEQTKVPRKFRFPHLRRLTWYVARGWEERLAFLADSSFDATSSSSTTTKTTTKKRSNNLSTTSPSPSRAGAGKPSSSLRSTLLARLPPHRVLLGLERLLSTLSDDIDLLLDPYATDGAGEEKLQKQKKAAREAIPLDVVGPSLSEAEAMVRRVEGLCEVAVRLRREVVEELGGRVESASKATVGAGAEAGVGVEGEGKRSPRKGRRRGDADSTTTTTTKTTPLPRDTGKMEEVKEVDPMALSG